MNDSNVESLLKAILYGDPKYVVKPQSRVEALLLAIYESGGGGGGGGDDTYTRAQIDAKIASCVPKVRKIATATLANDISADELASMLELSTTYVEQKNITSSRTDVTSSGTKIPNVSAVYGFVDSAIKALDADDAAETGKYVSEVSEKDGKIIVKRADLPTSLPASDVTNTYDKDGTVPVSGKAVASAIGGKIDANEKGTENGLATLDEHGKVPSSQLIDYRIYEVVSESYAKVYKLQIKPSGSDEWIDVTGASQINIPKDMVVESGSVKECTEDNVPVSGYKRGDKYIDLVIANKADAHIYINVKDLIDNNAEGIQYSNTVSKLAATNVQSAIDEIVDSLKNTINPPSEGEVGQVLTVKTVDSSGKPTEWEYTEKGGGGEGGTTNYDDLSNKPAIDGNTLTKDSTADTLGLAKKSEIPSIEGLYSKPESGIPASDMSEGVRRSLGKADTALQEHQSLENYVKTTDSRLTNARASNDVQAYAKIGSGITVGVSVPSNAKFTDTTYSAATTSANGLMSSSDKTKLNGIATGATAVSESTVSGWGFTKNDGTVTKVKVGTTDYSPASDTGVVALPAYPTSLPANGGTASNVSGTVAVSHGGTGATTAANARTNLGLGGAATKSVDTSFAGSSASSNLPTTAAVVTALKNEFVIYPCFASPNATLKSGSMIVFGNQVHVNCKVACNLDTPAYWALLKFPFAVKSPAGSNKRYEDSNGWYLDDNSTNILSNKAFSKDEIISFNLVVTKHDTIIS